MWNNGIVAHIIQPCPVYAHTHTHIHTHITTISHFCPTNACMVSYKLLGPPLRIRSLMMPSNNIHAADEIKTDNFYAQIMIRCESYELAIPTEILSLHC